MKVPSKNEKAIAPLRGFQDVGCTDVFVKARRKNDSIISWNIIGRRKRCAINENIDGDDNNAHEDDDERIAWLPNFESLSFELDDFQTTLNELS